MDWEALPGHATNGRSTLNLSKASAPDKQGRSPEFGVIGAEYSVGVFVLAAVVNALIVTLICSVVLLRDSDQPDYAAILGFVFVGSFIITLSGLAVASGLRRARDALGRRLARARRRRHAGE